MNVAISTNIFICNAKFSVVFFAKESDVILLGVWQPKPKDQLTLSKLFDHFSVTIPEFTDIDFSLEEVSLQYYIKEEKYTFAIKTKSLGALSISKETLSKVSLLAVQYSLERAIYFQPIPVIGKAMAKEDYIKLNKINIKKASNQKAEFDFNISIHIFGMDMYFPDKPKANNMLLNSEEKTSPPAIKWIKISNDIKMIHLHKIGFSFAEGKISIYLDCGLTIAMLTLECLNLYASFPITKPNEVRFGIKGMAISVDKKPLMISGALLYEDKTYSGLISIRYNQFGLLALGSYKETEYGSSLFLFLMITYPLGGPPCFYITGLSAGFGINRGVKIPALSGIENFPFVKAALGQNPKLAKAGSAGAALAEIGDYVYEKKDQYFVCAGIQFTSFSMVQSFALLMIEFGARFEISLLGISQISIPPLVKNSPIAYAKLLLRAIFCPADGILLMKGALSNDSYLFSKECKLTGGFAFYCWFTGIHAGDFVFTLGGYYPGFSPAHYPKVDRVGIKWVVDSHLTIEGNAYFAITSTCIMAGGMLSVVYQHGKLKAWCYAMANIIMQWKPFYYAIEVAVTIGASYRIDFWFIHKTLTVELGAALKIHGPEFAGSVHISWYIISFTINFGAKENQTPPPLNWSDFSSTFLADEKKSDSLTAGASSILDIQYNDGLLKKPTTENSYCLSYYLLNGKYFLIDIKSKFPITSLWFNGEEKSRYTEPLGIVPMNITAFQSTLNITLKKDGLAFTPNELAVIVENHTILQNIPKALWGRVKPSTTDDLIRNVPMGVSIFPKEQKYKVYPASIDEWYDTKKLEENQKIFNPKPYEWNEEEPPTKVDYSKMEAFQAIEDTIVNNESRSEYMKQLESFRVHGAKEIMLKSYSENWRKIANAPAKLNTTASLGFE